jgi:hypothetical protein
MTRTFRPKSAKSALEYTKAGEIHNPDVIALARLDEVR